MDHTTTIIRSDNATQWEDYPPIIEGLPLSPSAKNSLLWLIEYAADKNISRTKIAREIGCDLTTLTRVLTGTYPSSYDGIVAKASAYRALIDARSVGGSRPEFVHTIQARRIWQGCDTALREGIIIPVIGKTHIGKTWALEAYANTHPNVIYLPCPVPCNLARLLRKMAKIIGVDPVGRYDDVTANIQSKLTHNHLVIIDEIHQAVRRPKAMATDILEWLRLEIHDATKCGMILSGTPEFGDAFVKGPLSGMMTQIAERGRGYVVKLPNAPTNQDVQAIWTHYGLSSPDNDSMAIIGTMAVNHGMAQISGIFHDASRKAGLKQEPLTWQHFKTAYKTKSKLI